MATRQPVQTPGDPAATGSQLSNASTAPAKDIAPLAASGEADKASEAAQGATITVNASEWEAMQRQMADLQNMVRRSVETGMPAETKPLPTLADVAKWDEKPTAPVLTQEGWLVPTSEVWAVTAVKKPA